MKKVFYFSIFFISTVISTGCVTDQQVIEMGDTGMSCNELTTEINKYDLKRKDKAMHSAAGAGGAVAAMVLVMPIVGMASAGYMLYQGNEAHQSRERMQHLTNTYNQKGCATHRYAGTTVKTDTTLIDIQNALIGRGYTPGAPDGIYGKKTKAALEHFQEDNGLQITGKVDANTKKLLLD